MSRPSYPSTHVQFPSGTIELRGSLMIPWKPRGLVILTHPSFSSYLDPRMRLSRAVWFAKGSQRYCLICWYFKNSKSIPGPGISVTTSTCSPPDS